MSNECVTGDRDLAGAISKAGWRIFPLLGLGYLIAYVDRVNVGFAALQMNADLKFSAAVYGLGAGLFFLSYALFEIPSNLLLIRFGARRWIARIMITWGLLATATIFVRTPFQFYAVRFLIGAAEAGFFPGAVYYLAHWFPNRQRGRAISRFYLFNPLGTVVMGILSVWLLSLDGLAGLRGWQWIFLVEGFPAVIVGLGILLWLPDAPDKVGWLAAPERASLTDALARDAELTGDPPQGHILTCLLDPNVRWLALMYVLSISVAMTFNLSAPILLKERTGLGTDAVGYLVSLGGVLAVLSMLVTGWISDQRAGRFTPLLVALAGEFLALLVIALAPSHSSVVLAYLLYFAAYNAAMLAQTIIWADVFHLRVLGICGAAINTALQMGSFLGPAAFGAAHDVTGTYQFGLNVLPFFPLLTIAVTVALMRKLKSARDDLLAAPTDAAILDL